jgi:dTDP-glucose 4,6-dehydratase
MRKGRRGATYNIGGGCEKANLEVVEAICSAVDRLHPLADDRPCRELITFVKDRPGHDRRYAIDFNRLQTELGWQPQESFETGIAKTIQWYMDNGEWVDRIKTGEYRQWIETHYDLDGGE